MNPNDYPKLPYRLCKHRYANISTSIGLAGTMTSRVLKLKCVKCGKTRTHSSTRQITPEESKYFEYNRHELWQTPRVAG